MTSPDAGLRHNRFEDIACALENTFAEKLMEHDYWAVALRGSSNPKAEGQVFDVATGLLHPSLADLTSILAKHPFLYIKHTKDDANLATLDTQSKLLWTNKIADFISENFIQENSSESINDTRFEVQDAEKILALASGTGSSHWRLPSGEELKAFSRRDANPYRKGTAYRLSGSAGTACDFWLTNSGGTDLDDGRWRVAKKSPGRIFACDGLFLNASPQTIFLALIKGKLRLESPDGSDVFDPQPLQDYAASDTIDLQRVWAEQDLMLHALDDSDGVLDPAIYNVRQRLIDLDYTPCRLPKLDAARLTDPEQGLWELYYESADFLCEHGLVARDPSADLQDRAVAIDFGTSSTAVAVDTPNGDRELLRIGVRDFYETVQAQHFENPTVLECIDFNAFSEVWQRQAYRPALDWDWMRASHEAQTSLRDNPGTPEVLASILPNLKHWALYSQQERRTRLCDRQGVELEVPPHSERNPVRGEALTVSKEYRFDPIELYAWYLGMAINWRGRGLFFKYYLSFPVKYDSRVKERILASFRCGLQRSLPRTLINSAPDLLNDIEVSDLASEPTAYAAAALEALYIDIPEDGHVAYGVFDFGGGTTDFDYGLWRWSTDEEDNRGYDTVFESLGSGGDQFLGGENLLSHLVYATFSAQDNLDVLRQQRIQFTRPLDAKKFPGSEPFLADTQAAQTNSIMLAAKLRSFLEEESPTLAHEITLDLLDTSGRKQECSLIIDEDALDTLLKERIHSGFSAFLAQMARVHTDLPESAPIHCLLAGNGSRSRYIQQILDDADTWQSMLEDAFGSEQPEVLPHPPLAMDNAKPHAPTAKTGVALGLLRIKPGENTLLINHVRNRHDDQAPFSWYVGGLRRGHFTPKLLPDTTYGEWIELGPLQEGVFNLYTSRSPRAASGMKSGDAELNKRRLDFPAAPPGARLYAKAITSNEVILACADSQATPDTSHQKRHSLA